MQAQRGSQPRAECAHGVGGGVIHDPLGVVELWGRAPSLAPPMGREGGGGEGPGEGWGGEAYRTGGVMAVGGGEISCDPQKKSAHSSKKRNGGGGMRGRAGQPREGVPLRGREGRCPRGFRWVIGGGGTLQPEKGPQEQVRGSKCPWGSLDVLAEKKKVTEEKEAGGLGDSSWWRAGRGLEPLEPVVAPGAGEGGGQTAGSM